MLIVVPDDNPPALVGTPPLEQLQKIDEVRVYDSDATDPAVLAERLKEADIAVNIRGRTRFTADVLQACPRLKLISIWGTGTDNVDLKAAAARGIAVTNTPGANALAVAEHTVALILAVVKQLAQADRAMRQGGWPRNFVPQLRGKRLGLIGTGLIGREVAGHGARSRPRSGGVDVPPQHEPGRLSRPAIRRFGGTAPHLGHPVLAPARDA